MLQINSTQKPYLTWIKINVALHSLCICYVENTLLGSEESDVKKAPFLPLENIQLTNCPEGRKYECVWWGRQEAFLSFIYVNIFI